MTDNALRILGVHACIPERIVIERKLFPYSGKLAWVPSNRQALSRLRQGDIEVMISSLNSGAGDGLDLARESRELVVAGEIPPFVFILTTGEINTGKFAQALQQVMGRGEVDLYLPKPFSRDQLRLTMDKARSIVTGRN